MEEFKVVTVDLETTGIPIKIVTVKKPGTTRKENLDYKTEYMDFPYIVSIAWKINNGETREFIINQEGREIPKEASDIHGITTEIANSSKNNLLFVLCLLAADCVGNDVLVGHNMYFDTSIIKANILRLMAENNLNNDLFVQVEEILCKFKRVDTMRSTIAMMGGKWGKLTEVYQVIFNEKFESHSARHDVDASKRIYDHLLLNGLVPTVQELREKKEKSQDGIK